MRSKRRSWLVLALTVAVALITSGQAMAQAPAGKKIALLIGVNEYDKRGFRDLMYAERDVEELAKLLKPAGYEIHLLTGSSRGLKRATLANVKKAIEAVLKDRNKRDLVLVAFAGHGLQFEIAAVPSTAHLRKLELLPIWAGVERA